MCVIFFGSSDDPILDETDSYCLKQIFNFNVFFTLAFFVYIFKSIVVV